MFFANRNYQADTDKFLEVFHYRNLRWIGRFLGKLIRGIKCVFVLWSWEVSANFPQRLKRHRWGYRTKGSKARHIGFEYGSLIPGTESLVDISIYAARRNISPQIRRPSLQRIDNQRSEDALSVNLKR